MLIRSVVLWISLLLLLVTLALAFTEAQPVTAPLSGVAQLYNERTVAEVGATNVVSAINFDWRAYDTLGEVTIFLTAATGVKLVMRRYLQRRRETGIA